MNLSDEGRYAGAVDPPELPIPIVVPARSASARKAPRGDDPGPRPGGEVVDLSGHFPMQPAYVMRRSVRWLLFSILAALVYFLFSAGHIPLPWGTDRLLRLGIRFFPLCFLVSLVRWELHRRTFRYRVEGGRLVVERGVFVPTRSSLPILPISEVAVRRTGLDLLFGLHTVHLITAVDPGKNQGVIEGLSRHSAHGMYTVLSNLLRAQQPLGGRPERANGR